MKIIKLQAENVKKLKAIEYSPPQDDTAIVIGGRNAQGKTSLLDAIELALSRQSRTKALIRTGEDTAEVRLTLDGLTVHRRWSENGRSTLTVTNEEGAAYRSPQGILDKLVGDLTFDPLAFSRANGKDQAAILKKVIAGKTGFNFEASEKEAADFYIQRREVNRLLKQELAELEAAKATAPKTAPPKVDMFKLVDTHTAAQAKVTKKKELTASIEANCDAINDNNEDIAQLEQDIKRIQELIAKKKTNNAAIEAELDRFNNELYEMGDPEKEVEFAKAALDSANDASKLYEAWEKSQSIQHRVKTTSARWEEIDDAYQQCKKDQQAAIEKAKLPIEGLKIDGELVTFGDVPMNSLSSAESLLVSAEIAAALNPRLQVCLIRDGAYLDDENLLRLKEWAAQRDMQIWIEVVGEANTSLVIEDGEIK